MKAEEIRQSFVEPELAALAEGDSFAPDRSLSLATWELAAQLAEFNDRMEKIDRAGKENS